jgi:hypothetical protein
MCIFSGPVEKVNGTNVFCRMEQGIQTLVYGMSVYASRDVSMILPLPVKPGTQEINFIALDGYPNFFQDMENGFVEKSKGLSRGLDTLSVDSLRTLKVEKVGNFEASFVPTLQDFDRIDGRFKLSPSVWASLPQYSDFAFAVFQLTKPEGEIHPMAFQFASRWSYLFFPTVHIHNGELHHYEHFDHRLYCQSDYPTAEWRSSYSPTSSFMKLEKAKDILHPTARISLRKMIGKFPNMDTFANA